MKRSRSLNVMTRSGWEISGVEDARTGVLTLKITPPDHRIISGPMAIMQHLTVILERPNSEVSRSKPPRATKRVIQALDRRLSEFPMSKRLACGFVRNISWPDSREMSSLFIGELVQTTEQEFLRSFIGCGRVSFEEIIGLLAKIGLCLGMKAEVERLGWTPEGAEERKARAAQV